MKCAQVEDTTKVPQKFRYPFFTEMLWYVLAKYVYTLLGRSHLDGEENREHELINQSHVHLTHYELFGLKEIVMFLYDLPPNRKNVPELIKDPVQLIKDVRSLVERHCKDLPEMAITGVPILHPDLNKSTNKILSERLRRHNDNDDVGTGVGDDEEDHSSQIHVTDSGNVSDDGETTTQFVPPKTVTTKSVARALHKKHAAGDTNGSTTNGTTSERSGGGGGSNAPRRRRRRCKNCVPCNSTECGHCAFCLDMVRYD